MYNVNLRNSYGQGSQAAAFSAYGNQMGLYACQFLSFQVILDIYRGLLM